MWITNSVGLQELNPAFVSLVGWIAAISLGLGLLGAIIRSAVKGAVSPAKSPPLATRPASPAFPVSPKSGPTRYRIVGVDKASRMEVTDVITATTPDNARAKAELDGVLVTSVEPA